MKCNELRELLVALGDFAYDFDVQFSSPEKVTYDVTHVLLEQGKISFVGDETIED